MKRMHVLGFVMVSCCFLTKACRALNLGLGAMKPNCDKNVEYSFQTACHFMAEKDKIRHAEVAQLEFPRKYQTI